MRRNRFLDRALCLLAVSAVFAAPAVARADEVSRDSSLLSAASGTIGLRVAPVNGREAIAIDGVGPAQVPVTLTLRSTIDSDLPITLLSRTNIVVGDDGRFHVVVPIAPGFWRGSTVTVDATSLSTIKSATAELVVGPPTWQYPPDTLEDPYPGLEQYGWPYSFSGGP